MCETIATNLAIHLVSSTHKLLYYTKITDQAILPSVAGEFVSLLNQTHIQWKDTLNVT